MRKKLPHPEHVLTARDWLRAGAPVNHPEYNSAECVKLLLELVEALPSYIPQYAWGSDEWKKAMAEIHDKK